MKIKLFTKKAICAALLASASVSANAIEPPPPIDLDVIAVGIPKSFSSGLVSGEFWNKFVFILPANGGSGYDIIDIPLNLGSAGTLQTTFTAVSLVHLGDDGLLGGTGDNADTFIKGSFSDSFSNFSMQVTPLDLTYPTAAAGGRFMLNVIGQTTGSLGGVYSGSISVSAPPVPEPESYAMFLAGLGLMGAIVRRRMRSQS